MFEPNYHLTDLYRTALLLPLTHSHLHQVCRCYLQLLLVVTRLASSILCKMRHIFLLLILISYHDDSRASTQSFRCSVDAPPPPPPVFAVPSVPPFAPPPLASDPSTAAAMSRLLRRLVRRTLATTAAAATVECCQSSHCANHHRRQPPLCAASVREPTALALHRRRHQCSTIAVLPLPPSLPCPAVYLSPPVVA